MTKIAIPRSENKIWRGIFPNKFDGNIHQTFNIDLEREEGRVALSGRMRILKQSDSDLIFGNPLKFILTKADRTERLWVITNTKLINVISSQISLDTSWQGDTAGNSPTANIRDAIVHSDTDNSNETERLIVALDTELIILNNGDTNTAWDTNWWSDTDDLAQPALKSGDHVLAKLQKLTMVTDKYHAHTIDKNDVVNNKRLTWPDGYQATCVYTSPNRFWIGLKHDYELNGMVIEWDGSSETFNRDYPIDGIPISGWVKDGVPTFVNNNGQIMKFNGAGFTEVKRFPFLPNETTFLQAGGLPATESALWRYGCIVDGDIIRINIGSPSASRTMRSGVWIYNPKTNNLYHNNSFGRFTGDSDLDFGQGFASRVGAIFKIRGKAGASEYLVGGLHHLSQGTTKTAIYRDSKNTGTGATSARGYFVTSMITTNFLTEFWKNVYLKFKQFIHDDNKLVVKYRAREPISDNNWQLKTATMTWLSGTQIRGIVPSGIEIGNEVEIANGPNAGCNFHISAMSDTDGAATIPNGAKTVDITIDETAPNASDTGKSTIYYNNWVKSGTISDTSDENDNIPIIGSDSDGNTINNTHSIQFKVELRGKEVEVDQLLLTKDRNIQIE